MSLIQILTVEQKPKSFSLSFSLFKFFIEYDFIRCDTKRFQSIETDIILNLVEYTLYFLYFAWMVNSKNIECVFHINFEHHVVINEWFFSSHFVYLFTLNKKFANKWKVISSSSTAFDEILTIKTWKTDKINWPIHKMSEEKRKTNINTHHKQEIKLSKVYKILIGFRFWELFRHHTDSDNNLSVNKQRFEWKIYKYIQMNFRNQSIATEQPPRWCLSNYQIFRIKWKCSAKGNTN